MKPGTGAVVVLALFGWLAPCGRAAAGAGQETSMTLTELIRAAQNPPGGAVFHPPPRPHFEALREAVRRLTAAAPTCDDSVRQAVQRDLQQAALEAIAFQSDKQTFWIVREQAPVFRGAGIYVCRCGTAAPLVVQAPHAGTDYHTARLARVVFRDARARWLFVSSISRFGNDDVHGPTTAFHPADAAHNPLLLFQAATEGALSAEPDALFTQLHGFETLGRTADAIVSELPQGGGLGQALLDAWRGHPAGARLYGQDTRELGGLSNVQGQAVAERRGRFLHLELSLSVRKQLVARSEELHALATALALVARNKR